jgi:hypothetical protein
MSGRVNGGRTRMLDLEAARRTSRQLRAPTLTPDEASILIDRVLFRYGMDPTLWTDLSGWRHLMIGSAEGFAGVVEWQPDEYYLVVLAPILDIPPETRQQPEFYQMLLELNYHGTLSAHFSIYEDTLYLGLTRPIRGLDEDEVDEAIRTVMILADSYDDRLKEMIHLLPPPMPQLPDIRMRPHDAQVIGSILGACDPHGQDIFRFLMENWETIGNHVEVSTTGIALSFFLDDQPYALAALHPGFADRKQEIILGWEGLRKKLLFSEEAIVKFQSDVGNLTELKTTANTAHIEITEDFNLEKANALLTFMDQFARAATLHVKEPDWIGWDSHLPKLKFVGDPLVKVNVRETLQATGPRIQDMFVFILQGWLDAGGGIECFQPGRIYLKFQTCEHKYGRYGVLSHQFNLAVLATASPEEHSRIELAWNLASGSYAYLEYAPDDVERYEKLIAELPGFQHEEAIHYLVMDDSFLKEHASQLLNAMLDLKTVAGG